MLAAASAVFGKVWGFVWFTAIHGRETIVILSLPLTMTRH